MMRLGCRVSLLVALSLLAPTAAYTECAWVLWVIYGDGSGEIKLARETLKGCRDELSRDAKQTVETFTVAGFKPPIYRESDETHKVMIFLRVDEKDSKPFTVRFQCLPDTSPRPPKP